MQFPLSLQGGIVCCLQVNSRIISLPCKRGILLCVSREDNATTTQQLVMLILLESIMWQNAPVQQNIQSDINRQNALIYCTDIYLATRSSSNPKL